MKKNIYLEEELYIREGEQYIEIALNESFTRFIGNELIQDLLQDYTLSYKGINIESYKDLYKAVSKFFSKEDLASKAR